MGHSTDNPVAQHVLMALKTGDVQQLIKENSFINVLYIS